MVVGGQIGSLGFIQAADYFLGSHRHIGQGFEKITAGLRTLRPLDKTCEKDSLGDVRALLRSWYASMSTEMVFVAMHRAYTDPTGLSILDSRIDS